MTVALLANPSARAGARSSAAERAARRLREHGLKVSIVSGGSAEESTQLLRTALELGATRVVVAGGDGTVGLAIQELAGTDIPLGVVPVGTGNDFAASFGLKELAVEKAADAVAAGHTQRIDLARITRTDGSTRLFGTILASGFDSKVNDRANRMRWPRGHSRYNIAILVEFLKLSRIPFDIELVLEDGTVEQISGEVLMAAVGNTRTYGGGIPMLPDADPSDGLLDVTFIRPAGRLKLARLLPRVYAGTHRGHPEVTMRRVRSARVSAPDLTAYADGDPVGALPLAVDVVPGALTIYTGAPTTR